MKLKLISFSILVISFTNYSMDIEQNYLELDDMFVEPATLLFQTAWRLIKSGSSLEIGEPNLIEFGNKIAHLQQYYKQYNNHAEIKLFITLIINPTITKKVINQYFSELIETYLTSEKFTSIKQLISKMLLDACKTNNILLAQLAIDAGADTDTKARHGICALVWAAYNGNEQLVQILLDSGANVNAKNHSGSTCLIWAIWQGHKNIVRLLLNVGADVNAKTNNGNTALMWAAIKGYKKIVKMLLNEGADPSAQSKNGYTALIYASIRGKTKVVKWLLNAQINSSTINIKDNEGCTALIRVALTRYKDVVDLLIKAGANLNLQDNIGNTALMEAVRWKQIEIVKLLLDANADIHIQNNSNITALNLAENQSNRKEILKLLKEYQIMALHTFD